MTSISEKDEFTRPSRPAKEKTCDVQITPVVNNRFAEREDESDDEIIFKRTEPGKKNNFKSASTQVLVSNELDTLEKSNNTTNNNKETLKNAEDKTDSDKPKTYTRRGNGLLSGRFHIRSGQSSYFG